MRPDVGAGGQVPGKCCGGRDMWAWLRSPGHRADDDVGESWLHPLHGDRDAHAHLHVIKRSGTCRLTQSWSRSVPPSPPPYSLELIHQPPRAGHRSRMPGKSRMQTCVSCSVPEEADCGLHMPSWLTRAFPCGGGFSSTKKPRPIQAARLRPTSCKDEVATLL